MALNRKARRAAKRGPKLVMAMRYVLPDADLAELDEEERLGEILNVVNLHLHELASRRVDPSQHTVVIIGRNPDVPNAITIETKTETKPTPLDLDDGPDLGMLAEEEPNHDTVAYTILENGGAGYPTGYRWRWACSCGETRDMLEPGKHVALASYALHLERVLGP